MRDTFKEKDLLYVAHMATGSVLTEKNHAQIIATTSLTITDSL